jgi:FtsH-binding integral membrane protein
MTDHILYPLARGAQVALLTLVAALLVFAGTWTPMYVPAEYVQAAIYCLTVVGTLEILIYAARTDVSRLVDPDTEERPRSAD